MQRPKITNVFRIILPHFSQLCRSCAFNQFGRRAFKFSEVPWSFMRAVVWAGKGAPTVSAREVAHGYFWCCPGWSWWGLRKAAGASPNKHSVPQKTWKSRVGVAKNVSLRAWIWLLSLFCAANEVIFKLVFCSSLKSCSPLLTVPLLFNKVEISVFFFCMKQWTWLSYSQSAPQLSSLIHISQSSSVWFPKTPCLPSYYLLS